DRELGDPEGAQSILQIRLSFEALQKQWATPTLERVGQGKQIDVAAAIAEGQDRMTAIRAQVLKLQEHEEIDSERKVLSAELFMRRVLVWGICAAALLGGILVFLTAAVTRQIVRPVRQLIQASEQVAQGNLTPPLPPSGGDEFGILSES